MASNQYINIFKFQSEDEKQKIFDLAKNQKIENRIATRARILILRDEGMSQTQIGKTLKIHRNTVMLWEKRYKQKGEKGLFDKPGRGRRPTFSP